MSAEHRRHNGGPENPDEPGDREAELEAEIEALERELERKEERLQAVITRYETLLERERATPEPPSARARRRLLVSIERLRDRLAQLRERSG